MTPRDRNPDWPAVSEVYADGHTHAGLDRVRDEVRRGNVAYLVPAPPPGQLDYGDLPIREEYRRVTDLPRVVPAGMALVAAVFRADGLVCLAVRHPEEPA